MSGPALCGLRVPHGTHTFVQDIRNGMVYKTMCTGCPPPDSTEAKLTVDATAPWPDGMDGTYVMIGSCTNCRTNEIEITYSRGYRARTVKCPVCFVLAVMAERLVPE